MKHTATLNYRLEKAATVLAAMSAAGLLGWALVLALGIYGDAQSAKLPAWKPFALPPLKWDGAVVASPVASSSWRLVGVAGDRAYIATGSGATLRALSLAVGDAVPSGEKIVRIERAGMVLLSAGQELPVSVFGARGDAIKKSVAVAGTAGVASGCRLTGADRVAAIFIAPDMAKALSAERATFARMFEPLAGGSGAGIRAKGTGGTTAMFAIVDGDVLLRADGAPIKSSDAIITEVLARVERGSSVVVEGERGGAPRRWVYAPSGCARV